MTGSPSHQCLSAPSRKIAKGRWGVFFGAFAWVCFFTWVVGHLRRFGGQRWLAGVDFAGGLTLLAFAGRAIWRLITSPL